MQKKLIFVEALNHLSRIAESFQRLYERCLKGFERFHANPTSGLERENGYKEILQAANEAGFEETAQCYLADFILAIKPTTGQLTRWHSEKEEAGLEKSRVVLESELIRRRNLLSRLHTSDESSVLIADTLASNPEQAEAHQLWPARFSACYWFDKFQPTDTGISVKSLVLYPGLATRASIVEKLTGAELVRDTGA